MSLNHLKVIAHSLELFTIRQNRDFAHLATQQIVMNTASFDVLTQDINNLFEIAKEEWTPRRGEIAQLLSAVKGAELADFTEEQLIEIRKRVDDLINNPLSAGKHNQ